MNQVSWLIYFSNVSENIGGLFIIFGLSVAVIAGVYYGWSMVIESELSSYSGDERNVTLIKTARKTRRFAPYLVMVAFVFWTVAAFCPNQNTVLAIAASQVGEQMLKTPTANLAVEALNAWLQRQIASPAHKGE